ncbi:MAG: carboxypeptidase regulatory-like domain-containing protein [Candidatus Zixiibacteriota bacterium]|nr:MAG: carboxypeptidase regulatory-like domain-containing protein [candidate division Zixibacteria bacterium]
MSAKNHFKIFLAVTLILASSYILLTGTARPVGILNNDGDTGEDSVSVTVVNWDSAGCSPISADSFWVMVLKSGDNGVVFKDSGTTSMTGLDTVRIGGRTVYYFHRLVSDIDGPGAVGPYVGELVAKNTSLGLFSCAGFSFQVVGWELDDIGDSAAFAAGLYDSLITKGETIDSLYALLDSIQNQSTWMSSFDPSTQPVFLGVDEFAEMADTIFGRDSNLYDEGYWHKLACHADSGSVGGPDSAKIAGWVWNTKQVNHTSDGTFGKYVDAEISGIGSGSGIFSHSIVAYDSTVDQVIPGVVTAVRNLDQTSLLAVGRTDPEGVVSFNLDAGSYLLVASASGYLFQTPVTIEVTGSSNDTVFGEQFDPGLPSSPTLCRVYGYLYDLNGNPDQDVTVSATLPSGVVRFGGIIVSPHRVSTVTDSEGYFSLDLIPSTALTPSGTLYEFAVSRTDGTILRQRLTVPDAGSWQLAW